MKSSPASASPIQSPQRPWHKITPRDRVWLVGLVIFVIAAFVGWKPLRHELMMSLALRSDGPSDTVLSELADQTPNRARTLERMWRSGNLTARLFVAEYLMAHRQAEPALVTQMEAIVEEAAFDPDVAVRERALNILAQPQRAEFLVLLRQQLSDADPAVRVLGMQQLQRIADSNSVPAAIRLLDDPDPRVVVAAALVLRRVTGLDFGIKTSHALPQFGRVGGELPAKPNLEAIQAGVKQWREWWGQHHEEFPEPAKPSPVAVNLLPAKDFTLEDSEGRPVRLSNFRGKAVLLCFWKIGDATSFDDLVALRQLQEQEAQRLTVLSVAFNPAVGPQDGCGGEEHTGGHEHQHGHAHSPGAGVDLTATKSALRDLVTRMGVNHPVLVDTKGAVVFRHNVQEVPAYALIDAQGNLRRRFNGSRELPVWTAMIQELSNR
ncbi:MAG: HEAT repeat domain-containing protein [Verrucomicrobiota bacterium]